MSFTPMGTVPTNPAERAAQRLDSIEARLNRIENLLDGLRERIDMLDGADTSSPGHDLAEAFGEPVEVEAPKRRGRKPKE